MDHRKVRRDSSWDTISLCERGDLWGRREQPRFHRVAVWVGRTGASETGRFNYRGGSYYRYGDIHEVGISKEHL